MKDLIDEIENLRVKVDTEDFNTDGFSGKNGEGGKCQLRKS